MKKLSQHEIFEALEQDEEKPRKVKMKRSHPLRDELGGIIRPKQKHDFLIT